MTTQSVRTGVSPTKLNYTDFTFRIVHNTKTGETDCIDMFKIEADGVLTWLGSRSTFRQVADFVEYFMDHFNEQKDEKVPR